MIKLTLIIVIVFTVVCFTVNTFADDFYVIPVNNKCGPCKGIRSEGGRWCDNGDGTVTDMKTCLVWLKYADWGGLKPWDDCSTHDEAHTRAGLLASGETISTSGETVYLSDGSVLGDWRLPTLTELDGITEGNEAVLASTPQLFVGVQSYNYWQSTTYPSSTDSAWLVHMGYGNVDYYFKVNSYYVWPVRSGN